MTTLSDGEGRFVRTAVRRKRLFLILSALGLIVAVGLAGRVAYRRAHDPGFEVGVRLALVMVILLVARLNLRQFRYASVLEKLLRMSGKGESQEKRTD